VREIEERKFEHNNHVILLKLFETGNGFSVVAFLEGVQVSPTYSVSFETDLDHFMQHRVRLTEQLFDLAQSDIEVGMYIRT
jgi:hypothetical protein